MYLTRFTLPETSHRTFLNGSRQRVHAAVLEAFGGTRTVWDITSPRPGDPQELWVASPEPPVSPHSIPGAPTTRPLDALINKAKKGDLNGVTVSYELTVAPIRTSQGRRQYLQGGDAIAWVEEREPRLGMTLHSLTVTRSELVSFNHQDSKISFPLLTVQGTATITDGDALAATLTQGIGKRRTYGAGMLKIAPLKEATRA